MTAAAWIYSILHFALTGIRQPLSHFRGDFLASFPAWRVADLVGRLDMYRGSLAEKWGPPPIWHYGPVEHLITLPLFGFATLGSAYRCWLFVNYVFVAGILVLAIGIIDSWRPTLKTATIVVVIVLNFNPFYEGLTQRVIEIFELLLILCAFELDRKGRHTACGFAIGIASMAKFLPLIFLPYFVLKRNWRALGGALAAIIPIAIVTEFVLGWENSGILRQLRKGSFLLVDTNQSLSGAILRLLRWTHLPISGALVSRIAILICLIAVGALFVRTRTCVGSEDLEWATLAAVMILLPPHNQNYYLLFLLPGFLFLFARIARPSWAGPRWVVALLVCSFVITGLPFPVTVLSRMTGVDVFGAYLHFAVGFAGAAVFTAIVVRELLRTCGAATAERVAQPQA